MIKCRLRAAAITVCAAMLVSCRQSNTTPVQPTAPSQLPPFHLAGISVSPDDFGFVGVTNYTLKPYGVSGATGPLTYAWDLGDGTHGTGETVTHIYARVGTFRVALTVSDSRRSAQATTSVDVRPGLSVAAIQVSPDIGVAGFTDYTFQAQGISGATSSTLAYTWDFGDGAQATGENTHHMFETDGTFNVAVTVTDGRSTGRATATVVVRTVAGNWWGHYPGLGNDVTLSLVKSGTTWTGELYDRGTLHGCEVREVRVDFPKVSVKAAPHGYQGDIYVWISGDLNACVDRLTGWYKGWPIKMHKSFAPPCK